MSKRFMCVLLAVLMVFSTMLTAFAARADVAAAAEESEMCIYFDSETAGWSDAQYIGFHIWEIGGDALYDWGAKSERGTRVVEHDGDVVIETPALVWKYDFAAKGITLEDDKQYGVIFYSDKGAQTYNLLFGTECFGHTAQCDETIYENPEDSQKTTQAAFWDDSIDPEEYGPELKITSIGNVVGTCCPAGTTPYDMFCDFLENMFANARTYSGLTDQEILDDLGAKLGLTKDDVALALDVTETFSDWDYSESALEPDEYYDDEPKEITISFDAKSAGWNDSEWVGFHIWNLNDEMLYEYGMLAERGTENNNGTWSYQVEIDPYLQYVVVFYDDKGRLTYDLTLDTDCDGDTAYVKDDVVYEAPTDSNKSVQVVYWKDQDPEENGPVKRITKTGEVIGTCCLWSTDEWLLLEDFIENDLTRAEKLTGKSAQELLDQIGEGLTFYAEDIEFLLGFNGFDDVEWTIEKSTLPRKYNPDEGPYIHIMSDYFELNKGKQLEVMVAVMNPEMIGEIEGTVTFDDDGVQFEEDPSLCQDLFDDCFDWELSYDEKNHVVHYHGKLKDTVTAAQYDKEHKILSDNDIIYREPAYLILPLAGFAFTSVADKGIYNIRVDALNVKDVKGNTVVENGEVKAEGFHLAYHPLPTPLGSDRGDYDMDGDITVMDATRAQRIVAELEERPDEDFLCEIDADDDGELTVLDATRIQRVIADLCDWDGYIMGHLPEPSEYEEYELPIEI